MLRTNALTPHTRFSMILFVTLASIGMATPALHAQKDVHAALIAPNDRKAAPMFHLVSDSGKTMRMSDYRGRVVLLNFWATACGGCILEIPSFIDIQQAYKNQGFTAVGISSDIAYEALKNANEAWQRVRPFMASNKMNYPVLMADDTVVNAYGFKAYPATYLIDKSGRIAATYIGVVDKHDVESNVQKLLSEH